MICDKKDRAILIEARFADFSGGLKMWQESFYMIWRYQLTWNFAYHIRLIERHSGVSVRMFVKPEFEDGVRDMLADLGYCNVIMEEATVGIVFELEHDELDDIDILVMK